jgi:peptide methionine sulfoxide reductase msrA/msrB
MKKNDQDLELKKRLTPLQYEVTQEGGTEPPFNNEYWDNKAEGIYVDVVSGEPLFSSRHKYDSKTGWPSFFKPLEPQNIVEKPDNTLLRPRVEVCARGSKSHLGHVFDDGPNPTGKRYCMNSSSLRFIPKDKLEEEGYGQYLGEFTQSNVAYFAGGCFWCMQADFLNVAGVEEVISGYMGGHIRNPTYEMVCEGLTGHAEAVAVTYRPDEISYLTLLKIFWLNIDPTVVDKQFCDVGPQYRSAIFFRTIWEQEMIDESIAWLSGEFPDIEIKTQIALADDFYVAETFHQNYCLKNDIAYKAYRNACGRDATLARLYGAKREALLAPILSIGNT